MEHKRPHNSSQGKLLEYIATICYLTKSQEQVPCLANLGEVESGNNQPRRVP